MNSAKELVAQELQRDGKIPSAVHVTRGMPEFALDPTLPYHNPVFSSGQKVLFDCCVSSHLGGGLQGWKKASGPFENA